MSIASGRVYFKGPIGTTSEVIMTRPQDTVQAKAEIGIVDLNKLRLDDHMKRNILLRVQALTQVTGAHIERDVLFCTIDVHLLTGSRYDTAVQVLKHRVLHMVMGSLEPSKTVSRLTVLR